MCREKHDAILLAWQNLRQRSTANEEDRELYYRSLEAFDVEGEWEPLKLFLEAELVKTWDHPRFLRHAHGAKNAGDRKGREACAW